ncbi:MAG: ceramidase domain-containing protein [Acetobacteraceae bacterium]|nr:ceramidase domain-containing protein [Acetobacteraceae bacterium]
MTLACPALISSFDLALCRPVDIYCERTSTALDAELVNAFTNAAFLVAAWAAWHMHRQAPPRAIRAIRVLIFLMALTGLGSFLFHTVATRWAEWGDVIPIVAFMLAYMWFAMTWLFGLAIVTKLLVIVGFSIVTLWLEAQVPSTVLWGGAFYLPTVLVAVTVAAALQRMGHPAARAMAVAVSTFFLAFAMRSLDSPLCATVPTGTHFLWHLLNALFVYLLVRLAILHGSDPAGQPARG